MIYLLVSSINLYAHIFEKSNLNFNIKYIGLLSQIIFYHKLGLIFIQKRIINSKQFIKLYMLMN
jgi:hypothetical protein